MGLARSTEYDTQAVATGLQTHGGWSHTVAV